tara:strand:+ start:745 stop:1389 length:645 start_codon:yes stop_codon:yes gene_type:complete
MDEVKTYNIVVDYDTDTRMMRNSFVDMPAVEIERFAFSKMNNEMMVFNADKNNQCFMSVSILANTPIPRINEDGEPFNVVFTKDVIRVIANKLSIEGKMNEVSWQHTNQILDGVYLVEQFISEKGRVYSPLFDVPEGSLIQTYFVKDKKVYDQLINDENFKGFSIEIEAGIQEAFTKSIPDDERVYEAVEKILFDCDLTDDEKYSQIEDILKNR